MTPHVQCSTCGRSVATSRLGGVLRLNRHVTGRQCGRWAHRSLVCDGSGLEVAA